MVLRACPDVQHYSPGGSIKTWKELVTAGAILAPMLQINRHTYQSACRSMGPENTAVVIACIYEREEGIRSAGAYLRDLSRRASLRQFCIGPMVAALLRSRAGPCASSR